MKRRTARYGISVRVSRRQLLVLSAVSAPLAAHAQQDEAIRKIGVLIDGWAPHPLPDALRKELAARGYVEGREITFDVRYAKGNPRRAAELAADLVAGGPSIIVAHFTPAVRAAMAATNTIPIIMAPAGAPVETGLVASLGRPGGNVTGVTNMAAELGGRRLQLLKDLIPNLRRVAVLASTTDAFTRPFLSYMQKAAESLGLQLDPVMATSPPDFASAFADIVSRGAGAIVIQGVFNTERTVIIELASRYRMPTMWFERLAVPAGGFISLSANIDDMFRRAAIMVVKVLKGAKPADLPVEQPATFDLIVNLKTARALGLTVPADVLVQANEIIE